VRSLLFATGELCRVATYFRSKFHAVTGITSRRSAGEMRPPQQAEIGSHAAATRASLANMQNLAADSSGENGVMTLSTDRNHQLLSLGA